MWDGYQADFFSEKFVLFQTLKEPPNYDYAYITQLSLKGYISDILYISYII